MAFFGFKLSITKIGEKSSKSAKPLFPYFSDQLYYKTFINQLKGITGIKGKVYPVVYVDESAILDVEFINFERRPPSGFGQIMFEQSIL